MNLFHTLVLRRLDILLVSALLCCMPSVTVAVERCAVHGADAAQCFLCDASLRDPARLWCGEHGRYEDRCWLCHPELQDPDRLYCAEHGLYEDECFACDPARAGATANDAPAGSLYCGEHDLAENECGICHPELADGLRPGDALKIRLPSAAAAAKAGVASGRPTPAAISPSVKGVGEVGYDLDRLVRVTPFADGIVREVHVALGDRLAAGAPLITLASTAVAEAKADYLAARAAESAAKTTYDREQELVRLEISAERDLDAARAELAAVRARRGALEQALRDLGFTANDLAAIARGELAGSSMLLRAPLAGTVIARDVVPGDVVSSGAELLRLAQVEEMWVTVAVDERELGAISPGQPIDVRSASTGMRTNGVVTWVSSQLDATTRTAQVRATIRNPEGRWKAHMFVDVEISTGAAGAALAVPEGAIHYFGGAPFVFVDLDDGLYEVRRVDLAPRAPGRDPRSTMPAQGFVIAGLAMHERVVTEQSFLVKSEFQKSRLGAGCVD